MNICEAKKGDTDLEISVEQNKEHDEFVIGIYCQKRVVGHVPKNSNKLFYKFLLLPNSSNV